MTGQTAEVFFRQILTHAMTVGKSQTSTAFYQQYAVTFNHFIPDKPGAYQQKLHIPLLSVMHKSASFKFLMFFF